MQFVHADKVPAEILGWGEELAAIRHEVHSQPELGFDTEKTVARIVKVLSGWGIENQSPCAPKLTRLGWRTRPTSLGGAAVPAMHMPAVTTGIRRG